MNLMAFQTIANNVWMPQELDFRLILTSNNNDKSLIPTNAPRFSLSAIFLFGILNYRSLCFINNLSRYESY